MKMNLTVIPALAVLLVLVGGTLRAQNLPVSENRELNLDAYVELLRQDVKTQKVAVLSQMMNLSPEQAAKFWPVYSEYDKELTALNDDRLAAIKDYAAHYGTLSEAKASELAHKALDLEARRNAIKTKYFERFEKALSSKLAAKFLQVENQLLMLVDLQISANLPVVE